MTHPYILAQNGFTNTETSMITTACSVTFLLCMFGIGAPLTTVGLSVWAADFSCAERRAQSVQRFQLCYAIGGLAFSFMPGMVIKMCGAPLAHTARAGTPAAASFSANLKHWSRKMSCEA